MQRQFKYLKEALIGFLPGVRDYRIIHRKAPGTILIPF